MGNANPIPTHAAATRGDRLCLRAMTTPSEDVIVMPIPIKRTIHENVAE